jgi:hypothetical protein
MLLAPERPRGGRAIDRGKNGELKPEQGSGRKGTGDRLPEYAAREKRRTDADCDRCDDGQRDRRTAKVSLANSTGERLGEHRGSRGQEPEQ